MDEVNMFNMQLESKVFSLTNQLEKKEGEVIYLRSEYDRLLNQNAEIAKEYLYQQSELARLPDIGSQGITAKTSQYEDGYPIVPNGVMEQAGTRISEKLEKS